MAVYGKISRKITDYLMDPQKALQFKASMDFADECDGFCPECLIILQCEVYQEMKDAWDSFYT